MIVVIDSTLLLLLINPRAKAPPADPSVVNAGNAEARLNYLLDALEKERATIILPAPAYAELLIRSPQTVAQAFQSIETARAFRIAPFDKRAALECAIMLSTV